MNREVGVGALSGIQLMRGMEKRGALERFHGDSGNKESERSEVVWKKKKKKKKKGI